MAKSAILGGENLTDSNFPHLYFPKSSDFAAVKNVSPGNLSQIKLIWKMELFTIPGSTVFPDILSHSSPARKPPKNEMPTLSPH